MRAIILILILGVGVTLTGFEFSSDAVSAYEKLLTGTWSTDDVRTKKCFISRKGEASVTITFHSSGTADVHDATGTFLASGGWQIRREDVLVATDPFVYQEQIILSIDAEIPALSITPSTPITLTWKKGDMHLLYADQRAEYRLRLKRSQVNILQ